MKNSLESYQINLKSTLGPSRQLRFLAGIMWVLAGAVAALQAASMWLGARPAVTGTIQVVLVAAMVGCLLRIVALRRRLRLLADEECLAEVNRVRDAEMHLLGVAEVSGAMWADIRFYGQLFSGVVVPNNMLDWRRGQPGKPLAVFRRAWHVVSPDCRTAKIHLDGPVEFHVHNRATLARAASLD